MKPASQGQPRQQRRVAIVGGGVSGIACSWNLRHTDFHVDIYESDDRLGGHANSVPFKGENGINVNVDTGYIAMEEATYRKLMGDLQDLVAPTNGMQRNLIAS